MKLFGTPATLPLQATPPSPLTVTNGVIYMTSHVQYTLCKELLLHVLSLLPCFGPIIRAVKLRI